MNNPFSKINVLIITYKQEDVIGRALDSVLCQKEFGLNKIIVCDDCSPDNNWGIIQQYAQRYPEIIEAYRNETNLGIYGNSEKVVSLKGVADFYYMMSGDDALCDGWFIEIQKYIINNRIESEDYNTHNQVIMEKINIQFCFKYKNCENLSFKYKQEKLKMIQKS